MFHEEEHDQLATVDDAIREFSYIAGSERTDQAWLLSDHDSWVRNPHYVGPPVRHPEDECYDEHELEEDGSSGEVVAPLPNLNASADDFQDSDIPF